MELSTINALLDRMENDIKEKLRLESVVWEKDNELDAMAARADQLEIELRQANDLTAQRDSELDVAQTSNLNALERIKELEKQVDVLKHDWLSLKILINTVRQGLRSECLAVFQRLGDIPENEAERLLDSVWPAVEDGVEGAAEQQKDIAAGVAAHRHRN